MTNGVSTIMRDDWTDFVPSYYSYYNSFMRMKRERKRVKRQRLLFLGLVVCAAILFSLLAPFLNSKGEETMLTLWSIANEYKGDRMNTAEFVCDIMAANEMKTSALNVGDLIVIPE